METTNDQKGYEVQSRGHRGEVSNCIIWQDIYLHFPTTYELIEYYT